MNFSRNLILVLSFVVIFGCSTSAQKKVQKEGIILKDIPETIDKKADYLFYLHGKIVTSDNPRPVSERFGTFEYQKILETFKERGFIVISEPRPDGTDIEQYAKKVTQQIQKLIKLGVKSKRITVVGGSQGSWIAMLTSTYLKKKKVKFVIMAGCGRSIYPKVSLTGRVLSIYEATDGVKSCEKIRAKSKNLSKYKEIELNTGLQHGFIYRPINEWVNPAIEWARK